MLRRRSRAPAALGAHLDPGAEGVGEPGGEGADIARPHRRDPLEGLVDARVAAVDQLDGTEPPHAGAGVLQAEREGAGDLALRTRQLELVDAPLPHAGQLLGQQLDHLGGAAGPARGVHPEQAGVAVAGAEGIHRVRQPALLADVLEQTGGHPSAAHRHQHRQRVPVLAERGEPAAAEVDVVLLGGPTQAVRGERGDVRRGTGGCARGVGVRGPLPSGGQVPGLELPAAAAQPVLEQARELVVVEVAHGGDDEVVGPVVLGEVGAHVLDRQRLDARGGAAHGTADRGVRAEHVGEEGLVADVAGVVLGHRELLEDDLPLRGQGVLLEEARGDHVGEHVHGHRDVRGADPAVVEGVLLGGEGVGVAAHLVEGGRDVHRAASRGALEQQVFEHVGAPGVGGGLVARADGQPQSDGRAAHAAVRLGQQPHAPGQDAAAHAGGGVEQHVGGRIVVGEVERHRSIVPRRRRCAGEPLLTVARSADDGRGAPAQLDG